MTVWIMSFFKSLIFLNVISYHVVTWPISKYMKVEISSNMYQWKILHTHTHLQIKKLCTKLAVYILGTGSTVNTTL